MESNHVEKIRSYIVNGGEKRPFTAAQLVYTAHYTDSDGIYLNRTTAQRLVDTWTALGDNTYTLDEELHYSAYHVRDLGDETVLRVMTQHGKLHDEPITGWSLICDLSDGSSYYRNRDGRIYETF